MVVNEKGEILSDSFEGKNYVGPYKVMNDLKKILADGPAAVPATSHPAAATTIPPVTTTAKSSGNSPSGTNWDETFKKKP